MQSMKVKVGNIDGVVLIKEFWDKGIAGFGGQVVHKSKNNILTGLSIQGRPSNDAIVAHHALDETRVRVAVEGFSDS